MLSLELILMLPKKVEAKLRKESEKSGTSIEELALEALCRGLDEKMDPSDRAELYARLSEKYLKEADDPLAKGDYVQASEKLWGAAALMVKAVAASRGVSISSHGELFSFVRKLGEEERNPELRRALLCSEYATSELLRELVARGRDQGVLGGRETACGRAEEVQEVTACTCEL